MKTGFGPSAPATALIGVLVGHRPELADDAEVVSRLQRQCPADRRFQPVRHGVVGVGVEAEDGAEVHFGGVEEAQPVGPGSGEGFLVRVDAAGPKRLQPDAGQEAAPRVAAALDLVFLGANVERLGGIADEDVVGDPVAEEAGGAAVAVAAVVIARLFLVEDEADDVMGAALVEGLLQRGVDHVVGRGDHVAEGADAAQIVAVGPEGPDLGHELVLSDSTGRLYGSGRGGYLRAGDAMRRAGSHPPGEPGCVSARREAVSGPRTTPIDAGRAPRRGGGAVARRLPPGRPGARRRDAGGRHQDGVRRGGGGVGRAGRARPRREPAAGAVAQGGGPVGAGAVAPDRSSATEQNRADAAADSLHPCGGQSAIAGGAGRRGGDARAWPSMRYWR